MFCTCTHVYRVYIKYVYIKSTTLYVPSSELELSQPLSRQRVCPSPQNRGGGGHTRLRVRGWGSPNSDDWRKSLALCLLCGVYNGWLSACLVSGRTQSRPLRCVPPPQEAEQPVHSVQGVQAGQGAGLHSSSASAGPLQPDTPPARAGSKHSRTWH
jgi:hypothetical protein